MGSLLQERQVMVWGPCWGQARGAAHGAVPAPEGLLLQGWDMEGSDPALGLPGHSKPSAHRAEELPWLMLGRGCWKSTQRQHLG